MAHEQQNFIEMLSGEEQRQLLVKLLQEQQQGVQSFELSFAQQRLWFIHQLLPQSPAYNVPMGIRLCGALDRARLQKSLDLIIERHATLRTRFIEENGQPRQLLQPAESLELHYEDFSETEGFSSALVQKRILQEVHRPFDLQQGPLLRGSLYRFGEEEHFLLLTMHHIISDGWSLRVIEKELGTLYEALGRQEEPLPLQKLPIQYVDFAYWQRQQLQEEALTEHLAYWREQLQDLQPLSLPTDYPRPALPGYQGKRVRIQIPLHLTQQLEALGQREEATLFMSLLTVFQILLSRYTGQLDIAVGSPIANRTRQEIEGLVGFFVNSLVLRTKLDEQASFLDLLRLVRDITLDAYAHQDLPFERLVEELQPERALNRNPLFQIVFALQSTQMETIQLTDLRLEPLVIDNEVTRFDLEFHIGRTAHGLEGVFIYNTDLFAEATIERMVHHYTNLLEEIVQHPQQPLQHMRMLSDSEYQQLIFQWSQSASTGAAWQSVIEQIETQAVQRPDALAVEQGTLRLTYHELNKQANQLAHFLRAAGITTESRIGVLLERTPGLLVALTGILKAGGAYIPLDPEAPEARNRQLLQEAEPDLLLTQQHISCRYLEQSDTHIVVLDSQETQAALAQMPVDNLCLSLEPETIAYTIYTSGSTGKPNGVQISHGSLFNLVCWHCRSFAVTSDDRTTLLAGLGFDASVWELWPYLCRGASFHLPPDNDTRLDPSTLQRWLQQQHISICFVPTPLAEQILQLPWEPNTALRLMLTGGDRLHSISLAQIPFTLVNNYGPTENTVVTTSTPVSPAEIEREILPPIGRPIDNVRIYILDSELRPVPVGVIGELYCSGKGLARGYLHRPDLTAEKFLPDPFSTEPGARMYRTGDLVRYRSDGQIEFIGRHDFQVKIRGFRIELGEIEATLRLQPGVRECSVQAYEGPGNEKRLIAYVVPEKVAGDAQQHLYQQELVEQWQDLYDETYLQKLPEQENDFNIIGWNSSYTGEPLPAEEMREWRDSTLQQLRNLHPSRVLEIGCGTGLLLLQLAGECERYVGTDFSRVSLQQVSALVQERHWSHVSLLQRRADEEIGLNDERFDLVILNSVIQYFPDVEYLLQVLKQAVQRLSPGGVLFIGDVRDLRLLEVFRAEVRLLNADASATIGELLQQVQRDVRQEEEFLLHPQFFECLPAYLSRIREVTIRVKKGKAHNELTKYRYDVLLRLDQQEEIPPEREELSWQSDWTPEQLRSRLQQASAPLLVVKNVPNGHVQQPLQQWQRLNEAETSLTVGEFRAQVSKADTIDPEVFRSLAHDLSYVCDIRHTGVADTLELLFAKENTPEAVALLSGKGSRTGTRSAELPLNWSRFANNPLRRKQEALLEQQIRAFLSERLPEYMRPTSIMQIDALPLTAHGKVDRKRLPVPTDYPANTQGIWVSPRTELETRLAQIWAEVLGVRRLSIKDNFFELGGHSLLGTQLMTRIRSNLQLELPLKLLFEAPTVEAMAARLEQYTQEHYEAIPILNERERPLQLSFAQQRLWFLDQLAPGNPFYNVPIALKLTGPLHHTALEQSIREILRRHESLRTVFRVYQGEPHQVILSPDTLPEQLLPLIDLTSFSPEEQAERSRQLAIEEAQRHIDLARDLMLRAVLLRLAPESHILLLTLHHIAADGWSMQVLSRELSACYTAFLKGETPSLPPLPVQYADFALWQRQRLTEDELQKHLAYWTKQLEKLPFFEIPTDFPRSRAESFRGAQMHFSIPASLVARLQTLSQKEGVTLFMTLLTAFQTLLMRHSRQQDIVVGSPIANRRQVELEQLIGFFVNTLVLRVDLSGNPSFLEALHRVREVTLGAYEHQDLPFERLVEELQPERNLAYNPLCQILFQLVNTASTSVSLPGIIVESIWEDNKTAKFDVQLSCVHQGEDLFCIWEYNTDLFHADTIERLTKRFLRLLTEIVANPQQRIQKIALLEEDELQQLLVTWNRTRLDYPQDQCIHQFFERQAEQTPEALALAYEGHNIPYQVLQQRTNQLAHYLQRQGVQSESPVGICFDRSPELIIAMLAILKAGGAYIPLDPAYPPERLAFMIQDAGISILLTHSRLVGLFAQSQLPSVLTLDTLDAPLAEESVQPPSTDVQPDSLAYIIYTSGSTGAPKGVMISHRSLLNLVRWHQHAFQVTCHDRATLVAGVAFDASTWEIWPYLLAGASLHIPPQDLPKDAIRLQRWLIEHSITISFLPTLLAEAILPLSWPSDGALRLLLTGGDKLNHYPAPSLPFLLMNNYGPTENAVVTTSGRVLPEEANAGAPHIGRPISNTRVYVLDEELQPVPPGAPGELFIGGQSLARGYFHHPDLTAERFIPDPFSNKPGERLYSTGDLVRYRADGNIEFLGRRDFQVKLRGFRIELEEIEAVLRQHEGVQEAAVVLPGKTAEEKRLVACVVPRQEMLSSSTRMAGEHVSSWQHFYEELYHVREELADPTFNRIGWISNYTGLPFSEEEMRSWLEDTIHEIRRLQPRRILEIGCGTGMLLFKLAPACEVYYGSDFSAQSLAYIEQTLKELDTPLPQVHLWQRYADDFRNWENDFFDVIILNSVVQYFPDVHYLLRVLHGAIERLAPGGAIFLGDVRSLPLLEMFQLAVQLEQAPDSMTKEQLQQKVMHDRHLEEELVIDPALFVALAQQHPRLKQAHIFPKRGPQHNELTQFRYQVILYADQPAKEPPLSCPWLAWETGMLAHLHTLLTEQRPTVIGIEHIPNARLDHLLAAQQWLEAPNKTSTLETWRQMPIQAQGIELQELEEIAKATGYAAFFSWARQEERGSYDALFVRRDQAISEQTILAAFPRPSLQANWHDYANQPLEKKTERHLLTRLRSYLQKRLPEYMVPARIMLLDTLPLTPNGKLDRNALTELASLDTSATKEKQQAAPRTPVEQTLADIWCQVLKLERIGIHENFFELGGHSLLATQVVSRINNVFQMELPLRALFETPTIAEMAQYVTGHQQTTAPQNTLQGEDTFSSEDADQLLEQLDELPEDALDELLNTLLHNDEK